MPLSGGLGPISRPVVRGEYGSDGYQLFSGSSINPIIDFTRDNSFCDDPVSCADGFLIGPDGKPMRRVLVDDDFVRSGVSDSVNSSVKFSFPPRSSSVGVDLSSCNSTSQFGPGLVSSYLQVDDVESLRDVRNSGLLNSNVMFSVSAGTHMKFPNDPDFIAADSGTEYTILTMSTAREWGGRMLAQMKFIGATGDPFSVFGGDDLLVEVVDSNGTWRVLNLGKSFVSPYANLDLASSHQMQLRNLGTVFEMNGSAYLIDLAGNSYPLVRKNGLWQFQIRFPNMEFHGNVKTAYQAAMDEASGSGDSFDVHTPGSFASRPATPCCDPKNAFTHAASGCCSRNNEVSFSCGAGGDFAIQGIELSLPDNLKIKDEDMAKIFQRVANMKKYHVLYNHRGVDVLNRYVRDGTISDGIILQSISCVECEASTISKSPVSRKHAKSYDIPPFHMVQGDIYDAEDVVARDGYKYVLAFIDVVTGAVFQFFMVSKSEALVGFKAFESWLELQAPYIKSKWGSSPKLSCVCFDRDGALTTTFGGMRSVADQYFIDRGYNRLFTSRGASNGTEKIERYFKSLKAGIRVNLLTSGFSDYMFFDAAHAFCYHYNRLPTRANRVSDVDSPYESLGLKVDRSYLRLFGSCGSRLIKNRLVTAKEYPGESCFFIGYGTDSYGYRVVIPDGSVMRIEVDKDVVINSSCIATKAFVAKCRSDPSCGHMLQWINIMFRPMDTFGTRSDLGSDVESFPGIPIDSDCSHESLKKLECVASFSQEELNMLGRPVVKLFDGVEFNGKVIAMDHDKIDGRVMYEVLYDDGDREDVNIDELNGLFKAVADRVFRKSRQTVGASPQDQSRLGLSEHMEPVNSKCLCSKTEAKTMISSARRNGQILIFNQNNPKLSGTKSFWRYEQYKLVSNFGDFDALCKIKAAFLGKRVFNDKVIDMDPVVVPKACKGDLSDDYRHGYLSFVDNPGQPAASLAARSDGGPQFCRGSVLGYLDSKDIQSLEDANGVRKYDSSDVDLFEAAKSWWATSTLNSAPFSSSPVEIPAWFALACYHKAEVWVCGMKEPISLVGAMKSPEWPLWKAAIEKEIIGLLMMDLWTEVPRESVPVGQRVNSGHFIFKVKSVDGEFLKAKARFVFGGHRSVYGVDYLDTMANMASLRSVRTVFALGAPAGHYFRNFDLSQAFTFSECDQDVYMELPPLGMMGIVNPLCGQGKESGNVAKLKRMLYGMKDSGRKWMQLLDKFFRDIGAVPTITDSMVYNWKFNGFEARFAVHVDDILCSAAHPYVHTEFSRLLRERFGETRVTEEPTTFLLGMKVHHDRERKQVVLSQAAYTRKLLAAFGIDENVTSAATPLPPDPVFQKFDGIASQEDSYRMMCICGGLQWLQTCTRPDIAFATNMLARYASNPSPEHISYANRVLRYLSGTIEMGITYHGTDEILNSGGYDITNKLIGTVDSDLGGCKDSEKSTSGIVLMLNGGPIMWRSTRQSTVSTGTAEAECKAAGFAGQQLIPVRDLLCELGFEQPSVRMLEDNSAAVQLSFGTGKLGKSGHFRRMVAYLEGLTNRNIFWLDHTPSKENPSDIMTKSVSPAVQFTRMRDVINGTNPVLFVSAKVRDLCCPIVSGSIMSLDVPVEMYSDICSGLCDLNIEMI